jgi:lysophospholipase L1-like esterase
LKLTQNAKIVMIGDSITDAGRQRPVGEGMGGALGSGYVNLVDALLTACYPSLSQRVVNMGAGGNTIRDMAARWQTDVLDLRPDWLSVMIGINDVWRQFDSPTRPEHAVPLDEYAETLEALVARTLPTLPGSLVLMTPFYIEPNPADAMRACMDKYGAAVRAVAQRHGALFVDTQAAFNAVLTHLYPATLGWDRVHPGTAGHMILARAFLQALDFAW